MSSINHDFDFDTMGMSFDIYTGRLWPKKVKRQLVVSWRGKDQPLWKTPWMMWETE